MPSGLGGGFFSLSFLILQKILGLFLTFMSRNTSVHHLHLRYSITSQGDCEIWLVLIWYVEV